MSDKELRKQLVEAFRVEGWGTGDCEPPCNCRGCYNAQNALASIALKVVRPLREQIAQEIEAKCAKKTWRITFDAFPGEMELFGCPQDVYDNDTMLVCTHYEDAAIARGRK